MVVVVAQNGMLEQGMKYKFQKQNKYINVINLNMYSDTLSPSKYQVD